MIKIFSFISLNFERDSVEMEDLYFKVIHALTSIYDFQSNFEIFVMSLELNRLVLMTAGTLSLQSMGSDWKDLQKVIGQFMSCLLRKVGWTATMVFSSFRVQRTCNIYKSAGWHD